MGQKANPIGNRLGIIRGWDSNWFGGKDFGAKVVEDEKIRQFIFKSHSKGGIARIVIERTLKRITVTIHTSRPGIVIGKGGKDVDVLREALKKLTKKDVQINIFEIRKPDLDAAIVGEQIAKQLEARINYRRAIKLSIQNTMRAGAEGIKVRISGRLNGADMARSEEYKQGRTRCDEPQCRIVREHRGRRARPGRLHSFPALWGRVSRRRDQQPARNFLRGGVGPRRDHRGGDPLRSPGAPAAGGHECGHPGGDRRGRDGEHWRMLLLDQYQRGQF